MDMLTKLVRIRDARHVKGLSIADKGPQGETIRLSNHVIGNTITAGIPACRDLPCNGLAELEGLRDKDACTLLEFREPPAALARLDIALVTMLKLELVGCQLGDLGGFKVILDELDLLVEDLLNGVVTREELRF
ncbi:hypothetical protein Hypma_013721 [Hypsizygus marmoreus]|uniref:Uncharacterized protein n=1 Tax=Hypsizygus marmoreus TaxID=39966 RepID=A0A369JAZ2_HYPMA|nr:hypothetical protein Hypma_013721 [Hypsizygus marmoreus]